jgi:hypothetical protein
MRREENEDKDEKVREMEREDKMKFLKWLRGKRCLWREGEYFHVRFS